MRPLVWFRSDLRVRDNTALSEACKVESVEKVSELRFGGFFDSLQSTLTAGFLSSRSSSGGPHAISSDQ